VVLRADEEERVQAAMQVIGDGIGWATFCSALNVTDDEARRMLHEMGHRHLAGFAGGWVSPDIDVMRKRLALRANLAATDIGADVSLGQAVSSVELEAVPDVPRSSDRAG
jgi:hypothetical protein